ncbi:MAG: hypothetical protein AAGA87_01175 [Pseudomonadota bacterium]
MAKRGESARLLLVGVAPRLGIALAIAGLLWLGFFWATTPPRPL